MATDRVLIIGLSNIGDAIIMSPVVARVHAAYPAAIVTLVVGERARAVFEHDPRIHRLIVMDEFDGAWGRLRLALELRRLQPQVVIDLRSTALPLVLAPGRAARYFRAVPRDIVHMRDRHLWKLRTQDPDGAGSGELSLRDEPTVWIRLEDHAHVERLITRWQVDQTKRLAVICPGARSHTKRWPVERFAGVADALIEQAGCEIVFTAEPAESEIVLEAIKLMRRRAHNAVSCITVPQLGALMQRARIVITNDSASLHMAGAVGTPVIAIFGPTDARKYGPVESAGRAIHRKLVCAPCEQALCRFNHECMRFVSVDEVFRAACDTLGVAPTAPAVAPQRRAADEPDLPELDA